MYLATTFTPLHPTYVALTWIKHRTPPENMGTDSLHHEAPLGFKNIAESSKSPFTLTHRFGLLKNYASSTPTNSSSQ